MSKVLLRGAIPTLVTALALSCGGNGAGGVFVECGNGQIEGSEACDDGNAAPCDGCDPNCETESGWVCGDGILNQFCGEQCDDGDTDAGDGCDPICRPEGAPLDLDGEYEVAIAIRSDTCGLGAGSGTAPMNVVEQSPQTVEVDIPVGGAGGECDPQPYARDHDTLTRTASSTAQIGSCNVRVDVTTLLGFFPGGVVTGFEIDTLSAEGGNCSGLSLPCTVWLDLDGTACGGCFSCVPAMLGATRPWGSLATGAGMGADPAGN